MHRNGLLRVFGIASLALVINLLIFGVLSLLNWQKAVYIPAHLGATDIVHLQPKKPKKPKQETARKKIQPRQKKSLKKPPLRRKTAMDRFLRNVKLGSGLGIAGASELFLPQKDEMTSILEVETGKAIRLKEELVDLPPRPIFCKRPEYPRLAKFHEIEGIVEVEFVVTTAGTVKDISIIKSIPEGVFDKAVFRVLRIWKFEPAQHKNKIVECWCAKRFRFVLTDELR